jgi:predicted ATPase
VRRILPADAIQTPADAIQLDATHIQRDITAFDTFMADALTTNHLTPAQAAQLAQGITLYRADLLLDIYDDWVYRPREQRRERYLHGLELLAGWEKQNGRLPAALDYILTLTKADPLRESAHQEAMRLYTALGRPRAARQHYEQFRGYLYSEMGLPPNPQTQQLAAALNAAAGLSDLETAVYLPTAAPTIPYALSAATPMPLIGRELERGQLVAQLNRLSQGQGGLVFLSGIPGVGKSRLLEELSRDAAWRGQAVAWGSGRELAAPPPYTLFREALSSLLTPLRWQQLHTLLDAYWLDLAAPLLGISEAAESELPNTDHNPLEALSRLLLALGQLRPLLLILDDVQWADAASLEALIYLSHRLRQQPVLVVLAFRSEEARAETAVWRTLDTLDATGLLLRLHLEPLSPEAATEFISQGLGLRQEAPLFSQRLYSETAGVPLLLLESLRLLHDEGLLYRDERGEWHTPYDTGTTNYAEITLGRHSPATTALLERRLRQLPLPAQQTLQLAAIIGREVQFGWLLAASSLPQSETLAALSLLVQRQYLQETPQAYRFSHDKIRESVYLEIPEAQRQAYHRTIAAVISGQKPSTRPNAAPGENSAVCAESQTVTAQLAYHYRQGAQWPEALRCTLRVAGQSRDLHALTTALDSYAAARQILAEQRPFPPAEADQITYHILTARQPLLLLTGQTAAQTAELDELRQLAARLPDPAQRAGVLLKEADFMARVRAEQAAAISMAQLALALAHQHGLTRIQAEAWGVIGEACHVQGAFQESAAALQQAVTLWEALNDDPRRLMDAYAQLLYSERMNGRWAEGKALADRLLALALETGDPMTQGNAHFALAAFYADQGQHETAIQSLDAALTLFRRTGARLQEARALANLGYMQWVLRDYGKGIELQEAALHIFQEVDNQKSILLSYLNLATLYYEVGQMAQGEAYTTAGLALAQRLHLQNYELALLIGRAQALIAAGALAEGGDLLTEIAPQVAVDEEIHTRAGFWASWGMWQMGNGRFAAAAAAFAQAADLFQQEENTDFVTAMHSFQAYALWQMGEKEQALALSTQAIAALAQASGGEFIAETYWHHAQISASSGSHAPTAPNPLQQAYDTLCRHAASLPDIAWQEPFWALSVRQAIRAAWNAAQPQRARVCLPRLESAVLGRTAADQCLEIEWTPWEPADAHVSDKVVRRRRQLARLLAEAEAQGARPTIADLAEALDSSQPTIKRDLAALRRL